MTDSSDTAERPRPLLGCWLNLGDEAIAELVGRAGYDVALIDMEHSPFGLERAVRLVRAVQAGGARAFVRTPDAQSRWIGRLMDLGADGAMVPMVDDAATAERLATAARYAPEGTRGMAAGIVRASGYGCDVEAYVSQARERFTLLCQIETRDGVDNAAAIAAVDGVDVLFIGPFDLAGSLGHRAAPDHPVTRQAIEAVFAAARAAGKPVATLPTPLNGAATLVGQGYDIVFGGSDLGMLRGAFEADLQACRAATNGGEGRRAV